MSDHKRPTDEHDEPSTSDAVPQSSTDAEPETAANAPIDNGWADEPAETADDAVAEDAAAEDATAEDDGDGDDDASEGEEPERLYTKLEMDKILGESQDRFLRVMAEYDNFRRRTAREKEQWIADALEDFVKDLLPVFDSFDKAREIADADDGTSDAMCEGLGVTHKQLLGALSKYGIEVIDPVGEAFDPTFHEALMRQPSPDHEPGTVVTVFERGYKLGSRLLRPARTVVASED